MNSLSVPAFGSDNHPAGQIVTSPRRTIGARASALGGHRGTLLPAASHMTRVQSNWVTSATAG